MPVIDLPFLKPECGLLQEFQNKFKLNLVFATSPKLFLAITIITMIMSALTDTILDFLKAPSMQISVWRWELCMIIRYGLDWRYKDTWERF